jgi:HEPN domain-containing protein
MALPNAKEARPYYRAAKQRFEDARFLLVAGRTTGAIYLAGYSVECILKALVLSILPQGQRMEMLGSFRSARGHDYQWLKSRYLENGGPNLTKGISKSFLYVNSWAVEIRYQAATAKYWDAKVFIDATEEILAWADGRM